MARLTVAEALTNLVWARVAGTERTKDERTQRRLEAPPAYSAREQPFDWLLADCGVDLNSADYDARTSLHIAASEGLKHIVEDYLARASVLPSPVDRWGGTPLDDAKRHGHAHVVSLLQARVTEV